MRSRPVLVFLLAFVAAATAGAAPGPSCQTIDLDQNWTRAQSEEFSTHL